MEFKEYLAILKKNAFFILFLAIFGAAVSLLITAKITKGARLSQLFYVQAPKEALEVYHFEGYYTQEKARNFTDSAVVILESPDFTSEVVDSSISVSVRKVAPQVIRLTVAAGDLQTSQEVIPKIASAFNSKMISLSGDDQAPKLVAIGQFPKALATRPTRSIATVFGAVVGGIFALMVAGLKTYLRL